MTKSERLLKDAVAEAEAEVAARQTALALPEEDQVRALQQERSELDDETKAAVDASTEAVQPTIPFAAIRQRQGISEEEVLGGLKFNDGRPDETLPLDLLVIAAKLARVKWPYPYHEGDAPLCKSDNGIRPRDDMAEPCAPTCAECPEAAWPTAEERAQGKKRPGCNGCLNLLVVTLSEDAFVLNVHGMGLAPVRKYLGRLKRRGLGFFYRWTRLGTAREQGEQGIYYVPTMTEEEVVDKTTYRALAAKVRDYMASMQASVAKASDEALYGEPNGTGAAASDGVDNGAEEPGPFNV